MGSGEGKKERKPFRERYRIYIAAGVTAWAIFLFFHPVGVVGDAMNPTLEDGQVILVSKESYRRSGPELFSVVNFNREFSLEGEKGANKIRRVVGVPGDTVEIRDGTVYRNGSALKEPYAMGDTKETVGPVTLTDGEIFVLGDHREASIDSRHVGPLKIKDLRGECVRVIWPLSDWKKIETIKLK